MKKIILPIRFGIVTSAVLIAYFLVLAMFGLHTNPVFSFLNAGITTFGIYEAIRVFKLEQGNQFNYTNGFSTGLVTGVTATIVFTFFFLSYSTEINQDFLPQLLSYLKGGFDINNGLVSFVVAIMGLVTTIVATLTVMQLFKNSGNISQNK
ncbi:MAG: DUF4199 domain-containing protein [Flavobacteriales bacterium]|nr:DUF4199 domain-containing protein [Flavobacteriia bacterium]NCP05496.1 DUF4199 domain-containing protein [Flavobacteriales bacterium]PIV92411.1 MAG: DUF4199 domain-containing protein [Flavobacteriaceae bacterium CG17_big_fil_post_rev_8_21_14_2_50_33_15]PIY11809.1 MAG: DUF4199 domain-containing protein [Flavobacteriaceae bacterium CG_4_10_14_3_um_filter_33_47]PJB16746.1 MAG: DUF4199 domain-containing protein [Flavobacteriaceae bacterium CG_4_9_14_3_um_filter_33_16]